MSGARFLFLMTEGLDATVIDSQVVDGLVAVGREGVTFDLLFLADPRPWLRKRAYYAAPPCRNRRAHGRRRAHRPAARASAGARRTAGTTALLLAERLRARRPTRRTRAHGLRRVLRELRRAPRSRASATIFDCRGDGRVRVPARSARRPVSRERRRPRAACGASNASAPAPPRTPRTCSRVSTVLRDRLVARHGIDPARSSVVPCVADAEKFHLDEAERQRRAPRTRRRGSLRRGLPGPLRALALRRRDLSRRARTDGRRPVGALPDPHAGTRGGAPSTRSDCCFAGRYQIHSAAHHEVPRLPARLGSRDPAARAGSAERSRVPDQVRRVRDDGPAGADQRRHRRLQRLRRRRERGRGAVGARSGRGGRCARAHPRRSATSRAAHASRTAAERFARQRYAREMAALYRRLAEQP